MKAHKAVEALQGLQKAGRIDGEVSEMLIDKVAHSQKFFFDFGAFPVITEEEMSEAIEELRLPFPLCYFEIDTVGAVLARETDGEVIFQGFLQTPQGILVTPVEFLTIADRSQKTVSFYAVNSHGREAIDRWDASDNPFAYVYQGIISLMIRGLTVLNCSNVQCVDNPPPEALNKKRIKNGRLPLYSYKTLHIKISRAGDAINLAPTSGDRHGPRLHMRRGHIRRLPSGGRTWVQSCMVGSMEDGMAFKDYRVT